MFRKLMRRIYSALLALCRHCILFNTISNFSASLLLVTFCGFYCCYLVVSLLSQLIAPKEYSSTLRFFCHTWIKNKLKYLHLSSQLCSTSYSHLKQPLFQIASFFLSCEISRWRLELPNISLAFTNLYFSLKRKQLFLHDQTSHNDNTLFSSFWQANNCHQFISSD